MMLCGVLILFLPKQLKKKMMQKNQPLPNSINWLCRTTFSVWRLTMNSSVIVWWTSQKVWCTVLTMTRKDWWRDWSFTAASTMMRRQSSTTLMRRNFIQKNLMLQRMILPWWGILWKRSRKPLGSPGITVGSNHYLLCELFTEVEYIHFRKFKYISKEFLRCCR